MGDDREFIDLDSTQNWSQLDVKRELDNLEIDAETGKRYDFARGFSDDLKEKEEKVILDGLTSGLNYIPEEFLMAADEKKEADIENKPEEERPDVSWAYRNEEEVADDEPFIPIVDIKKAEAEAEVLRAQRKLRLHRQKKPRKQQKKLRDLRQKQRKLKSKLSEQRILSSRQSELLRQMRLTI